MASSTFSGSTVLGHSRRGTHWEFYSPRLGARLVGTSSLEYEHYVSLECDPQVETYEPQVKVTVTVDGKAFTTIFDSKVKLRDGRTVVNEVKFEGQVEEAEKQIAVQQAWATDHGCEHRVLTEKEIRGNPTYVANCHAMLPWAQPLHAVPVEPHALIVGVITGQDAELTIGEVAEKSGRPIEEVVSVVVREYIAGRIRLPNVGTVRFGKLTSVRRGA